MKLICIRDEAEALFSTVRRDIIAFACEGRDIEFVDVVTDSFCEGQLPQVSESDLVYKATRGAHALETLLISRGLTSMWRSDFRFYPNITDTTTIWSIFHAAEGLPSPKTVHHVTNSRSQLISGALAVGGYPLILKVAGGSLGLGVMRVDTQDGLFSVADFVVANKKTFILREFIGAARDVRAVVVGDRVVKVYGYETQEGDFRSNPMGRVTRRPDSLSEAARRDAVRAVHLIGASCGAVDYRVKANGDHYLLEVNLPFGLSADDGDVAAAMVDFLIAKSHDRT